MDLFEVSGDASLVCRRPVQVALAVATLHVLTSADGCDSAEC